jgi:3-phenylpropionate/trans-cinnamate dioxygenase ferredoxin subunit
MSASSPGGWLAVCSEGDVAREDVLAVHDAGCNLAIYRAADGRYYATDGLCTHEQAPLADGLVMGCVIECPKHNGRFDFTTGKATRRPARIDLKTYPVKVESGTVFVRIEPSDEEKQ